MKSIYGYLSGAALGLCCLPTAHAQVTGTTYGIGTCAPNSDSSVNVVGTTQLSIGGTLIPQVSGAAVFNQAECQCQSRDIDMHFYLTTGSGLGPAAPVAEMWIGQSDCGDPNMRATKICDQVSTNSPPNNSDWKINGSSFQTVGMFDVVIPPEVVTNPKPATGTGYQCSTGGITNATISVTIGPPMMPAVCTMPVAVNTLGPTAPQNVALSSGDSGLVVSWDVPAGTGGIENYQVLCRKTAAPTQPVMDADFLTKTRYFFSSCIQNHLFRRRPGDLNVPSDPATTTDVPIAGGGAFPVDPRLRCTDRIAYNGTTPQPVRINGLTNGEEYEVMVVSIDPYGNASPSTPVKAKPQETAASLGEYCDGSNCPGFGCQAGGPTRQAGAAGTTLAGLMGLGLLLVTRRARRVA